MAGRPRSRSYDPRRESRAKRSRASKLGWKRRKHKDPVLVAADPRRRGHRDPDPRHRRDPDPDPRRLTKAERRAASELGWRRRKRKAGKGKSKRRHDASSWWGQPRRHAKAAKKGWRHRGR